MKRRDLLKTTIATIGVSSLALSGCSKNDTSSDTIIPKQTATYEFSAPLPFNYKTIDEMVELNSAIKKSQIKILYNNIPRPLVDSYDGWINSVRGKGNDSIKSLDDFGQYVKYALDKGFEFSYLMNSPKVFTQRDFLSFKDNFIYLLEYLHKIGVKNIKVASNQVIDLINEYAPNEFNLEISTFFGLRHISQYKNLSEVYSDFAFIDITRDENQNFELFKGLQTMYPDSKIELMVNGGCLKGCPGRFVHDANTHFCLFDCHKLRSKTGAMYNFVKSGSIFPWDMPYYSAMGLNNFKYVSAPQLRCDFHDLTSFKHMLTIIENGYENYTWKDLMDANWIPPVMLNDKNKDIKLSKIALLFPDMLYFIKHGDECATECEVSCNYCKKCADKIEKTLSLG